jgi:hypothetical protein
MNPADTTPPDTAGDSAGDGGGTVPEGEFTTVHLPVLATEVMEGLELQPGQTVVDGTLGGEVTPASFSRPLVRPDW